MRNRLAFVLLLAFLPSCHPRPTTPTSAIDNAVKQPFVPPTRHNLPVNSAGVPIVRVLLLANQSRLTLTATRNPTATGSSDKTPRTLNLAPNAPYTLTLTPAGFTLGSSPIGRGTLTLAPAGEGTLSVNARPYRGVYKLVPTGATTFDVVNELDVDSYLVSVVTREMLKGWEPEAFRTQAIAARTYAIYQASVSGKDHPFNLYADTRSQVYGGIADETPKGLDAVSATRGVVLAYGAPGNEQLFPTYFSACCGGVSQDSANHFKYDYPMMRARNNGALCAESTRYDWTATVTKTDLTTRLRAWGNANNNPIRDIASVHRVDVDTVNVYQRPVTFTVTDTRGETYVLQCEQLRNAINTGSRLVYSSYMTPTNAARSIRFDGRGSGHGVGLCQWCCQALALQGYRHDKIALYNYPGATLLKIY